MVATPPTRRHEKPDALPEFTFYEDTGCFVSSTCRACPLSVCIEELPRGRRELEERVRVARARQLHNEGLKPREIAAAMGIYERSVYRLLARSGG